MADLNQYLDQLREFDVNDIDWDRVGVWPAPAKIFLCIVAVIVILFGCHYFFISDKSVELETAKTQEATLRRSFESKAFEAANLDRYRRQMEEISGTLDALVSRLPNEIEVPGLLEDIDDKATEARLDINAIQPQGEVQTEFHIELPIRIDVTGGYHEFGAFVSGIAGMPRIVTLHDLEIERDSEREGQLTMQITAKTYRYKPQDE